MSTKGSKLTPSTTRKISLSKTKIDKSALISAAHSYFKELEENPKLLPTVTGYALHSGISARHLYTLSEKYPEVAQIIELIGDLQQEYCLTNGITNKANPIFSMFLLKSKHNFKDTPQTISQTNNFSISPDLLADALTLMKKK